MHLSVEGIVTRERLSFSGKRIKKKESRYRETIERVENHRDSLQRADIAYLAFVYKSSEWRVTSDRAPILHRSIIRDKAISAAISRQRSPNGTNVRFVVRASAYGTLRETSTIRHKNKRSHFWARRTSDRTIFKIDSNISYLRLSFWSVYLSDIIYNIDNFSSFILEYVVNDTVYRVLKN